MMDLKELPDLLRALRDEVETLHPHNREGWEEAWRRFSDLEEAGEGLSALGRDLLQGCGDVLVGLSEGRARPDLRLISALAQGLDLLERLLCTEDVDEEEILQVIEEIVSGFSPVEASPRDPGPSAGEMEFPHRTLDDAAAYLVQLDPSDPSAPQALRGYILRLLQGVSSDPAAEEAGSRALDLLDRAETEGGTAPEEIFRKIGLLFEQAATTSEGGFIPPKKDPLDAPSPPAQEPPRAEEERDYMPEGTDTSLLHEFINEASELLSAAEEALLSLETDPEDMEAVGKVFRAFHTVKGTSAFLDLSLISDLAHHAENILSRVRNNEIRYSGIYADLSLQALDMIGGLMQRLRAALDGAALTKPEGYDLLMEALQNPVETPEPELLAGEDSLRTGDILVARGTLSREQVEAALEAPGNQPIGVKLVKTKTATVTEVAQALRTKHQMEQGRPATEETTTRVATERLDRLIDLVGELVIAHSMVAQDELVLDGKNHSLSKKISNTNKIVRQLQDMSMSLRMIPLKGTFQKMARLVRDLSKKVGKRVELVTEGEDTEIDRNMVDIVNDPLVHMVRNSVDHGIEPPEERGARNKPPHGTVRLSAYHSAGNVVVEVRDDGRGLSREKILAKAKEKGVLEEGVVLSDRDVFQLVFHPGFSTAEVVTDVSGRGVGLDVVKKNVEQLRGQVDIQSTPGAGTLFRLTLPLTLAIIDGMVVRVGEERYILPTSSIVRTVKTEQGDILTVHKKGEMVLLQGELIPLVRLSSLFGIDRGDAKTSSALVTIVENDAKHVALSVDELIGRQQIVIKSLGETLRHVQGIAGGAVMPDGKIGLILDVGGLLKRAALDR